ncbi:acyltransferase family protein [Spongiibacter tropicus]|uniref:acyltransferase family protein n=1 Tax=Spongiibacter tropicus TaxID=454602 RepID=UPI0003B306FF|nr:acyltransferase family protein [Spongiibacter tropicus]
MAQLVRKGAGMEYRREVDGLRAVAVLPVILFHAGSSFFKGGFVGVDVFFVISGYLISTIIFSEVERGRFSIINFYERRARRILPALFLVIFASIPFAWLWMLPSYFNDFSKSLIFVPLFSSNILFWTESGYFGGINELKPLLHTWSLAVEEQYYVFFPIFAMIFWRNKKNVFFVLLIAATVASFLAAEWASSHKPSAAFFLLPARVWELFVGVFSALALKNGLDSKVSSRCGNYLSWLGLMFVVASIFLYDQYTPFPGVYALLPTVGTGLIIVFSSKDNSLGRFLGGRIFVWVGLVSYSAYLWHQPIFAFARHRSVGEPSESLMYFLSVLSIALAYLSWKYVEAPFRDKSRFSRGKIFLLSGCGSLLICAAGVFGYLNKGFDGRFSSDQISALSVKDESSWKDFDVCAVSGVGVTEILAKDCLESYNGPFVYLIGDSHAASISKALREALSEKGVRLVSWTENGCFPIPGTSRLPVIENGLHERYRAEVFNFIANHPAPVIISARWRLYLEGHRFDNQEGGVESGKNSKHYVVSDLSSDIYSYVESELIGLSRTVPLVIVSQIPEAGWSVPESISKRKIYGEPPSLSTSRLVFEEANNRVNLLMNRLSSVATVVYPDELLCNRVSNRCMNNDEDLVPLYRDDNHPSYLLSKWISNFIVEKNTGLISLKKAGDEGVSM